MNYLSHIFLSGEDRRIQIGNFIGDAVKGEAYKQYPLLFQRGILLHRRIDDYSDHHPLVKEAVYLGRTVWGRYAGVVIDILFDHFLAVRFTEYSPDIPLSRFAGRFYISLVVCYPWLPARIRRFLWHFIFTNRLCQYASVGGIRRSLEIMIIYRNLPISLSETMGFFALHYEELETLFIAFFPDLRQMCRQELLK